MKNWDVNNGHYYSRKIKEVTGFKIYTCNPLTIISNYLLVGVPSVNYEPRIIPGMRGKIYGKTTACSQNLHFFSLNNVSLCSKLNYLFSFLPRKNTVE